MFDPVSATIAAGSTLGNVFGAKASADAQTDAANLNAGTQRDIYADQARRFKPYEDLGTGALPELSDYDKRSPLPDYESLVAKPMGSWNYQRSPSYLAKNSLAQQDLNSQLQARGLGASGIGANRAADLSRRLTSEDYNNERAYRLGQLTDTYKARLADNTTRYSRILDKVKIGQGASASTGQAAERMGDRVGEATMAAGNARAGLYAGIPGAVMNTAATGLKMYDYGQNNGWWGSGGGTGFQNGAPNYGDFSGNVSGSGMVDNYGDPVGF